MRLATTRYDGPAEAVAPTLIVAHGLFGLGAELGDARQKNSPRRGRFIAVDLRNHGESPWADAMDYPAMAEDLLAVVDAEAAGRATLLGHSMGGKVSMVAASGGAREGRGADRRRYRAGWL